jgi:hypothetical protein
VAATKDVRKAARQAGLEAIADELVGAVRPAAIVRPGKDAQMPAERGTSRYGGDPDLPIGTRWPRCKGKPQSFLAQVRVRALPAELKDLRRLEGTLLFFTHVEFEDPDDTEYGLWAGDCSKVIHVRPGASVRRQTRPQRTLDVDSAPMRFSARPDVPGLGDGDHLMPPLHEVQVKEWEAYWNLRDALLGRTVDEDKLLGYSEPPNGDNACSARAGRPENTWRHLFMFTTWEVADGGRLQFLISPSALAKGRFTGVCGIFDSA